MSVEAFGLILLACGLVGFGVGTWLMYRRVRREVFTAMRHPSYSMTYNDDHHITVWERLPLYDWQERGEL